MSKNVYLSLVSKLSTVTPLFAKALLDLALKKRNLTSASVTPVEIFQIIRNELDPKLAKELRTTNSVLLANAATFFVTADDQIVQVNPAARQIFAALEMGMPLTDGETLLSRLKEIGFAKSAHECSSLEIRDIRIASLGRAYNVSLVPVRVSDEIVGTASVVQDITLRHELEGEVIEFCERLQEEIAARRLAEEKLKNSLKELQDFKFALDKHAIVAITDPAGRITYANDKFCEISKFRIDELLGKDHRIINSGYHPKEFFRSMWDTIQSGNVWQGEIRNKAKDGTLYWVSATIVPFLDQCGKPFQYVALRTDISERKRAEELLGQQYSKMATASKMAALGIMAGGVAHEINTPLATIQLLTEQLTEAAEEETLDRERVASVGATISETVGRIASIVRGLRTFSRDGAKDPFVATKLRKIVDDTLALCSERFRSHEVSIEVQVPETLVFDCRATQISQVLLNLLNNAFDSLVEVERKWIRIEAKGQDDMIEFSVTDGGCGVSEKAKEMLFHPFFTTKAIGKGTGLGLSVSRGIIESHHGTLELDTHSANTRFVVRLPKRYVDMKPGRR